MFIIYGSKLKARPLGRVADFCPICRCITAMRVREFLVVSHWFFIEDGSMQGGASMPWELTCDSCGLRRPATHLLFTQVERDDTVGLDELLERTNPQLTEKLASRLAIERQLPNAQLEAEKRFSLLAEPIVTCDLAANLRAQVLWERAKYWVMLLLFGLAPIAFMVLLVLLGLEWRRELVTAVGVAIAVVLITCGLWLVIDKHVYRRHALLPLLGLGLRPLRPTADELRNVLVTLRAGNLKMAHRLSALDVFDATSIG